MMSINTKKKNPLFSILIKYIRKPIENPNIMRNIKKSNL